MSILQAVRRELIRTLEKSITVGTLVLILPDGTRENFNGALQGPAAVWQIHDLSFIPAVASRGDIGLGEAYVSGLWDSPDLEALLSVMIANIESFGDYANGSFVSRIWFYFLNTPTTAQQRAREPGKYSFAL